jgi:hypothetical protein
VLGAGVLVAAALAAALDVLDDEPPHAASPVQAGSTIANAMSAIGLRRGVLR